jgi:hypothetical protein
MTSASISVSLAFCNPPAAAESASVVRFPQRRAQAIWIVPGRDDPWIVLAGEHGWSHGDHHSAITDAEWLARNFGLPIRDGSAQ